MIDRSAKTVNLFQPGGASSRRKKSYRKTLSSDISGSFGLDPHKFKNIITDNYNQNKVEELSHFVN